MEESSARADVSLRRSKRIKERVVDGMENTRDFHFPPRIKAKISEYASNYTVSNYA